MKGKLIAFRMFRHTDAKTTNRFCQKFYGQDMTSHGGKYRSHKRGLLEDILHVRLIRSVIIVSTKDAEKVPTRIRCRYSCEGSYINTPRPEGPTGKVSFVPKPSTS